MKLQLFFVCLSLILSLGNFVLSGCSTSLNTESDIIVENEPDINIEVVAVGPVVHAQYDQYDLMIEPDADEDILFNVRVTPINAPEGEPFYIALQVSSKEGFIFDEKDAVILIWTTEEMTKPIPPSPDERDSRILESYENLLSSWPSSKTVVLKVPAYDKDTASIIEELNDSLIYMRKAQWPNSPTVTNTPGRYNLIPISGMQGTFDKYVRVNLVTLDN